MFNRKAALNLTMEMIVVVVIAFVVLGLGLGFVRERFKSLGDTTGQIQEATKQQILDDLRTGNKKLSFPPIELLIEAGTESVQALGIKNTEDSEIKITVGFQVKQGKSFTTFTSNEVLEIDVGSNKAQGLIFWDDLDQTLKPGESKVIPVTITAPDKSGNYLYKIILTRTDSDPDTEYDTRTFFVKTS